MEIDYIFEVPAGSGAGSTIRMRVLGRTSSCIALILLQPVQLTKLYHAKIRPFVMGRTISVGWVRHGKDRCNNLLASHQNTSLGHLYVYMLCLLLVLTYLGT